MEVGKEPQSPIHGCGWQGAWGSCLWLTGALCLEQLSWGLLP